MVLRSNAGEAGTPEGLRFLIGPRWPLGIRLLSGGILLGLGTLLPFLFLPWVLGGVMILVGGALLAPRGLSNAPSEMRGEGEWKEVTPEEIQRVVEISRRSKAWGKSYLDGNTVPGILSFLVVASAALVFAIVAGGIQRVGGLSFLFAPVKGQLLLVFLLDVGLLCLPLWFFGLKRRYVPAELLLKIEALENIRHRLAVYPLPDWRLKILLEFTPAGKGKMPTDARLTLQPLDGPDDFIGLQVQVSVNHVQGTGYPYLYAVVLARESFGLFDAEFPAAPKEVLERETSEDVDVVVVRQRTTKNSGYHTKRKDQVRVFEVAVALAESALAPAA
ncbi:MAG: hypothetical protein ACYS47_07565 [Planctomycetota bacterium]|jgi:hypothetical protein